MTLTPMERLAGHSLKLGKPHPDDPGRLYDLSDLRCDSIRLETPDPVRQSVEKRTKRFIDHQRKTGRGLPV